MKRWGWILLLLGLVACQGSLTPAPLPTTTPLPAESEPQTLRIICPETIHTLMLTLATAYRQQDPTTDIIVIERDDQLIPAALDQKAAEIGATLWIPTSVPTNTWTQPFANEALAVVVNPQNGLPGITLDQLRQLYQGRVEDWAPWGGLPGNPQLISREEEAGEYGWFQEQVMGDGRVALIALLAPTSESVLSLVAEEPLAVGYVTTGRLDGRVRVLAIESVPPTAQTLAAGLYPLTHPVSFISIGEPHGAARPFIQWVLSPAGQTVIEQQGLYPLQK